MPVTQPALFIGHGSPMNAIEDNAFRREWQVLGRRLPRPQAILCISAHWETAGVFVGAAEHPDTIHDFRGFPRALFEVRYRAPGSPDLARRVTHLLHDYHPHLDSHRGLDHGVWGVLQPMFPEADIPVVPLSLDTRQPGAWHYELAQKLAPLRDEGVLIVGSGNIVHNLRHWRMDMDGAYDWAAQFDEEIAQRILDRHHDGLMGYETLGHDALMSVPTPEHYLPLLYALALQGEDEPVEFFNAQVQSSISMRSLLIGETG